MLYVFWYGMSYVSYKYIQNDDLACHVFTLPTNPHQGALSYIRTQEMVRHLYVCSALILIFATN